VSGKNSVLENKEYKDLIIKRFKNEVEMREKFQKQSFDNFSL
jgi:hypothetical protein